MGCDRADHTCGLTPYMAAAPPRASSPFVLLYCSTVYTRRVTPGKRLASPVQYTRTPYIDPDVSPPALATLFPRFGDQPICGCAPVSVRHRTPQHTPSALTIDHPCHSMDLEPGSISGGTFSSGPSPVVTAEDLESRLAEVSSNIFLLFSLAPRSLDGVCL